MNPPIRTAKISLGDKFVTGFSFVQYCEPVRGVGFLPLREARAA
jgi:hypothetical protein